MFSRTLGRAQTNVAVFPWGASGTLMARTGVAKVNLRIACVPILHARVPHGTMTVIGEQRIHRSEQKRIARYRLNLA